MTNEEAINLLDNLIGMIEDNHNSDYDTAFKMAIKALKQNESAEEWYKLFVEKLEQEPSGDAISRQAVLELVNKGYMGLYARQTDIEIMKDKINDLPPINPQEPKWIPVSERLPEDEQEILFSTKTGRVHSGKYHDDDSANQWYSHRDKCRAWNNVVSAWMPLPEPYKAESEDKEQEE